MKKWKQWFSLLVWGFVLAGTGGWIYEEICIYVLYGYVYNRGMLHLTLCPIYGFGAWGLYALFHRTKNSALFFALSVFAASAFEYGCSYLLEAVFHRSFWTYEGWLLSIDNRISLISSMMFGILALFFAKCILPLLKRHICKENPAHGWFVSACVSVAVIAGDFILVLCGK